jgi:hypothetical protein
MFYYNLKPCHNSLLAGFFIFNIMAKGLPYFKFTPTEWLTGNICFEPMEVQGLFINICALYWQRDGKLSIDDINLRYNKPTALSSLTDRYFSVNNGFVSIEFLNEQFHERKHISVTNSLNGSKGGRPKTNGIKPTAKRNESEKKPIRIRKEEEENKKDIDYSLENCKKLFIEKTAFNWTETYAIKQAELFYNFYSSKNWMVGKNKMKSVSHAIGGWIARDDKPELKVPKKDKPIFY